MWRERKGECFPSYDISQKEWLWSSRGTVQCTPQWKWQSKAWLQHQLLWKESAAWRVPWRYQILARQIKAVPCGRRGENKAWRVSITCVYYNLFREKEKVHWLAILDFMIKLFSGKLLLPITIGTFLLTAKPCLEMHMHTSGVKTRKELPSMFCCAM